MFLLLEHQDCKKNLRRGTNRSGTVRGTRALCAQQQCLSRRIWSYIFNNSVPQHPTLNTQCSFLALLSSYFPFWTSFSYNQLQNILQSRLLQCAVSSQERGKSFSFLGTNSHYTKCIAALHSRVTCSNQSHSLHFAFL